MAEKSNLAGSVGVTVFFGVYWDQYQQHPTEFSLFQDISRYKPILTGLFTKISVAISLQISLSECFPEYLISNLSYTSKERIVRRGLCLKEIPISVQQDYLHLCL